MRTPCVCLRCRELARKAPGAAPDGLVLRRESYEAGGGRETLLSFDAPEHDAVVAYLRVRFPSPDAHRPECRDTAIVRELKVTGREVPLALRERGAFQHRGLGALLMGAAEDEARDGGYRRVVVMSAVGTRAYYAKLGYARRGPYVEKALA